MKSWAWVVLCSALCLWAAPLSSAQKGPKAETFRTEGLFGNITAGEGGDYGGMQIYLTDSDGQFYAAVTVAEGVLLAPVLVKVRVQVEQRKVEFTLPGDEPRRFTGTVTAQGLTLSEGGQKIFLKRLCR